MRIASVLVCWVGVFGSGFWRVFGKVESGSFVMVNSRTHMYPKSYETMRNRNQKDAVTSVSSFFTSVLIVGIVKLRLKNSYMANTQTGNGHT